MVRKSSQKLPKLVVHADWGAHPNKRWMTYARLTNHRTYEAFAPVSVGETEPFISRLLAMRSSGDTIFLGFDLPIGLPIIYTQQCEIEDFLTVLPLLGVGRASTKYCIINWGIPSFQTTQCIGWRFWTPGHSWAGIICRPAASQPTLPIENE